MAELSDVVPVDPEESDSLRALRDNLGSLKAGRISRKERIEAIDEALRYRKDIFRDIGLK